MQNLHYAVALFKFSLQFMQMHGVGRQKFVAPRTQTTARQLLRLRLPNNLHEFTWSSTRMPPPLDCQDSCACGRAASRCSQHRRCTSSILSAGLQTPEQFQSKDAPHGFPACAFHSQSARSEKMTHKNVRHLPYVSTI